MSRRREVRTERRRAVRYVIREYERVSARLVRALRANDSSGTLAALVSLRAFVDEGIACCAESVRCPPPPPPEGAIVAPGAAQGQGEA